MYLDGRGVPQDDTEAIRWFRLAAAQEHPNAQTNLGIANTEGRGVSQSETLASVWFDLAAARGDPEAQYHLGVMYMNGEVFKKDLVEAYGCSVLPLNKSPTRSGATIQMT